ncbi:3773_t:CDS:2 [Gigaspora margarita]|uniref:3773_t:CDS:1 n=1 Tax=Gigaspora margarita TaxID=4874 RepID=A0ABN7VGH9_GIGMA|nr:3773_t:CDS:2 [Gigaspora margarita]
MFREINPKSANKYLKVELLNNNEQYNVRPIGKRKRDNKVAKSSEQLNKKRRISELVNENKVPK